MWIKPKQCVTTMETEEHINYQLIARLLLERLWLWYSVWTEDCDKWSHSEGLMMIVINVAQRHYSSYIKSPITHRSPMILDCCGVSLLSQALPATHAMMHWRSLVLPIVQGLSEACRKATVAWREGWGRDWEEGEGEQTNKRRKEGRREGRAKWELRGNWRCGE